MLARNGSLLAIAGVCALGVGLAPTASDAQGAQRAGPASAWSAPHARAVFPTEPVARDVARDRSIVSAPWVGTAARRRRRRPDRGGPRGHRGRRLARVRLRPRGREPDHGRSRDPRRPYQQGGGGLGPRGGGQRRHRQRGAHAFAYDLAAPRPHMVDLSPPDDTFGSRDRGRRRHRCRTNVEHCRRRVRLRPERDVPTNGRPGLVRRASQATDVDAHVVAGWSTDSNFDRVNPFAYDLDAPTPTMRNLGRLKGGSEAFAKAIDGNLVVGDGGTRLADGFHSHAFVADLGDAGSADAGPRRPQRPRHGRQQRERGQRERGRGRGHARQVLEEAQWAFAEDVSAPDPVMRSLGSLGGHSEDSAMDVDGEHRGRQREHRRDAERPRVRLRPRSRDTADERPRPRGPRRGGGTIRVSGNVVAGTQMVGDFDAPLPGRSPRQPLRRCASRRPRRSSARTPATPPSPWSATATPAQPSPSSTRPGASGAPRPVRTSRRRRAPCPSGPVRRRPPSGSRSSTTSAAKVGSASLSGSLIPARVPSRGHHAWPR